MSRRKQHTPATAHNAGLFGSPRILCAAALLAALSIVLGKYMATTIQKEVLRNGLYIHP